MLNPIKMYICHYKFAFGVRETKCLKNRGNIKIDRGQISTTTIMKAQSVHQWPSNNHSTFLYELKALQMLEYKPCTFMVTTWHKLGLLLF